MTSLFKTFFSERAVVSASSAGPATPPGAEPWSCAASTSAPTWKPSRTHITAGISTSRTPGTQSAARLLALTPPSTPNASAPSAGQTISPARLDMRKTCSWEPKCRGMRASLRRMMAAYPEANALFLNAADEVFEAMRQLGWKFYTFIGGAARFMCSWDTDKSRIDELCRDLRACAARDSLLVK